MSEVNYGNYEVTSKKVGKFNDIQSALKEGYELTKTVEESGNEELYKKFKTEYDELVKSIENSINDDKNISMSERIKIMLELSDIETIAKNENIKKKQNIYSKVGDFLKKTDTNKAKNISNKIRNIDISNIKDVEEAKGYLEYLNHNYTKFEDGTFAGLDEYNISELEDKKDVNVFQERLINKILENENDKYITSFSKTKGNFLIEKESFYKLIEKGNISEVNLKSLSLILEDIENEKELHEKVTSEGIINLQKYIKNFKNNNYQESRLQKILENKGINLLTYEVLDEKELEDIKNANLEINGNILGIKNYLNDKNNIKNILGIINYDNKNSTKYIKYIENEYILKEVISNYGFGEDGIKLSEYINKSHFSNYSILIELIESNNFNPKDISKINKENLENINLFENIVLSIEEKYLTLIISKYKESNINLDKFLGEISSSGIGEAKIDLINRLLDENELIKNGEKEYIKLDDNFIDNIDFYSLDYYISKNKENINLEELIKSFSIIGTINIFDFLKMPFLLSQIENNNDLALITYTYWPKLITYSEKNLKNISLVGLSIGVLKNYPEYINLILSKSIFPDINDLLTLIKAVENIYKDEKIVINEIINSGLIENNIGKIKLTGKGINSNLKDTFEKYINNYIGNYKSANELKDIIEEKRESFKKENINIEDENIKNILKNKMYDLLNKLKLSDEKTKEIISSLASYSRKPNRAMIDELQKALVGVDEKTISSLLEEIKNLSIEKAEESKKETLKKLGLDSEDDKQKFNETIEYNINKIILEKLKKKKDTELSVDEINLILKNIKKELGLENLSKKEEISIINTIERIYISKAIKIQTKDDKLTKVLSGKIDIEEFYEQLSIESSKELDEIYKEEEKTINKRKKDNNNIESNSNNIYLYQDIYTPEIGTIKLDNKIINLNETEQKLVKSNPEVLEKIVDFYKVLDKVGLSKLWNIKEQIFQSISNTTGIGFSIDGDYLNENETKIFLNNILKSVGEKQISNIFTIENFIAKFEIINGNQAIGEEAKTESYGEDKVTKIESKFLHKFFPIGNILGFKQSEFENSIK